MTLRALAWGVCGLATALLCAPVAATAQELAAVNVRPLSLPSAPPNLSPDCRSKRLPGEAFRRPLPALRRAARANRAVKVLAIGSSSTAGVGASSQAATYVAKLETSLEGTLKGLDFEVIGRGQGGEEAQGAADRMKREVEDAKPDLVVWQVGTNDAIRHVNLDRFKLCLKTTLAWLKDQRIDLVLVDPQYGDALAKDEYYGEVVGAIAEVARERGVMLVDRFESMRELARQNGDRFYLAADNLHLNDTGHRCTAEQLARSIVAGLLTADSDAAQPIFYP
ncbi:MAG TPA: GDSL-type esterase/lipase family protein [Hyphomicrobiaceae bacterium]|jgi:lysophospholipase L1-like esterase|nr:GDSL-type esterase/lipase family protein [Hyphomicrobiaceae bacterium]